MISSTLISVIGLLVVGTLQDEALGKVVRKPTHSRALIPRPESDREIGAEGRSARRNDDSHANKTGPTEELPVDELDEEFQEWFAPAEGSRSVGGAPAGLPPDWLVGTWYQQGSSATPPSSEFTRFAGFMIRLNKIRVLTYEPVCSGPENQANSLDDVDKKRVYEQLSFNLKEKINTLTGPRGTKRLFGCSSYGGFKLRNGDQMGVFQVTLKQGVFQDSLPSLKTKPPLQKDPNVTDNCYLYSYSGNVNPMAKEPGYERTFTRFEVTHRGCKESICSFVSNRRDYNLHNSETAGAVCTGLEDVGAPILCGADKKLSFLTLPLDGGQIGCSSKIKALSIANHYEKLSSYVDKTEQPAPSRTK